MTARDRDEQTDLKPRPDPTALTDAAIEKLHGLIMAKLDTIKAVTEAKFTHAKEMAEKESAHTRELTNERLRSVQLQFQERDTRSHMHEEKIEGVATRLTRTEGHSSGVAISWAVAVAVVGILMAFGGLFSALMRK